MFLCGHLEQHARGKNVSPFAGCYLGSLSPADAWLPVTAAGRFITYSATRFGRAGVGVNVCWGLGVRTACVRTGRAHRLVHCLTRQYVVIVSQAACYDRGSCCCCQRK
jgi:hypothetical protein